MRSAYRWLVLGGLGVLAVAGCGPGPSTEGLHQDCSGGNACASGQSCLHYTGLAGQPLASCEIACTYASDCPPALQCTTVSEGPTQRTCQ
ncbi:MAG TPA: hypothetical protein VND93_22015 [Myxococcales bacterium]|nr:hypothetical protein [Myxococcales bacterium]